MDLSIETINSVRISGSEDIRRAAEALHTLALQIGLQGRDMTSL